MKVFLLVLRRSGTTAFFEPMRQDKGFVCCDEPSNGMLRDLPGGNEWGTQDEFLQLLKRDPAKLWSLRRPISRISEIIEEFAQDGKAHFGDRFISLYLNDFCDDPKSAMERLYKLLGANCPEFDYDIIRRASPPAFAGHRNWKRHHDMAGLDLKG